MFIENSFNSSTQTTSKDMTKKINHYLMSEIFNYFTLDELFHMMQINRLTRDCVLKMKLVKHLVTVSTNIITFLLDDHRSKNKCSLSSKQQCLDANYT